MLQIDEKKETRLTKTSNQDEMQPRCSADGNQILYTSNPDSTFDIMLYDRAHGKTQRLTHMRVGANHPAWGPEQSILFNAFEKLSPSIFQSAIPNAKERLFADLPSTSQRKFFKWNGTEFTLSSERNIDQEVNLISEPVFEGKYVVNRQLVIREGLKNYTANSIAFVGDELVCRSFNGLPGDKNVRQDQYPQYFRFHGNEVKSLRSNMVAEKGLSQQTKIWASVHLEGRPIVQAWESQSQKYSLLQVNNRMASEYRNMKNRPPLGLVMYDHDRNHSTEISDSQVRRILRNQLQWVSFLDGSRVFFASGSKASGPFELFVWDSGKMTMLSNDAIRFTISKTHKSLAWIDTKNRLYHVRSSELAGDKKNVIDYRGKLIGFEFSDQETLIGITSSKTSAVYIQYFQPSHQTYKVVLDSGERIVNVAIDRSGTIAFLTQKKSDSTEFFVKVWDWNEKAIKKIDQHHHNISHFVFRDGYLTYIKRNLHAKPNREIVWKVGSSLPQYFDPIVGVLESNDQENLIVESKRYLRVYGAKDKKTHHVAGEIVGMDLKNDQIFFSEASERNFAVYQYDISTAQKNRISKGNVDSIFPKVFEESVYWSEKNEYWDL
ncbi:MAG: PD40 domain-containing protein, partial [Bdellovibrionales bacterium]|nr:PD40 domain-containing protein [Bdellovibrionales bacterium]